LDQVPLREALADLVDTWGIRNGITAAFVVDGHAPALPTETESQLFRVAQEALSNVARHAHASRVDVTLSCLDDLVLLDIRDDGVGLGADQEARPRPRPQGHGAGYRIAGMRRRLAEVSGRLEVVPCCPARSPGCGCPSSC
jgi:signal transduction histidine kinase